MMVKVIIEEKILFFQYLAMKDSVPEPNPEQKLWRYMDLPKLIALLIHSGLYFTRSDLLGDKHEGSYAHLNLEDFSHVITKLLLPDEDIQAYAIAARNEGPPSYDDVRRQVRQFGQVLRKKTFISCWHMNDRESMAMWSTYIRNDNGICLQTTYGRLKDSLQGQHRIVAGRVDYRDNATDFVSEGNTLAPYLSKWKSFEHDQELRFIIQDIHIVDDGPAGMYEDVKVDTLIERIYLYPGSPSWFREVVERVASKYGLQAGRLAPSELDQRPLF